MYRINEGTIDLPAEWTDRSINVVSSNPSSTGASLTITRDDIPWGMSFAEYVDDQAGQAGKALKNFEVIERREFELAGAPAHEIESRWTAKQGPIHQLITTVQSGRKVLILTASLGGGMSESQKTEMRRIVATLRLEKAEG